MIQSIIEFNDKEAGEILIPRVDIVGIESSESLDAAMDLISAEQFSGQHSGNKFVGGSLPK